uniref:Uncharacterized protein n=1 Tax=Arundo donax TaxID=35708 RepID=A0A0A9I1W2_ARUDO
MKFEFQSPVHRTNLFIYLYIAAN